MSKCINPLLLTTLIASIGFANAKTIVVNTENNADFSAGKTNLVYALQLLADGDTVSFSIPGSGVHYINTPADGYPLITKNNITIDGYSQPGASANSASIHSANNAVLKIVLTSTNGNALSMYTACINSWGSDIPNLGYGDDEQAILGFFHATNATVKGLVIQAVPFTSTSLDSGLCKSICFAANSLENGGNQCQNWHVSGCWFGVDPVTKQVAYAPDGFTVASPGICIANYRTRNAVGGSEPTWNYNQPGTIGVAGGSTNPRAEFNVFVTGYGYDSEGKNWRVSGNFFNVLPDGVTSADMSVLNAGAQMGDGYLECGRNNSNITIGTDGDGVNDADEGNIFGPFSGESAACLNFYSANGLQTNLVIAGNYFNADINGNRIADSMGVIVDALVNSSTTRFGSDFNGVSDALEANLVQNQLMFDYDTSWPTNAAWLSMRGNTLVNARELSATRPPLGDGQFPYSGVNTYSRFIDTSGPNGTVDIIPTIGAGTTTASLSGTCGLPVAAPYTRLVVDLYEADTTASAEPQGRKWLANFTDNSAQDSNPAVGAFTFNLSSLGIAHGTKVIIAVTYSKDTPPSIASISRAGNQTTLQISGTGSTYGIQKASSVNGPYTYAVAAPGGSATFTDNNSPSFYRATGPSATGQTSPFSDVFTMP